MSVLNIEQLKKAVAGEFAAIRRITLLEPQGEKVFPPTYESGEYADEQRLVRVKDDKGGEKVEGPDFPSRFRAVSGQPAKGDVVLSGYKKGRERQIRCPWERFGKARRALG